MNISKKNILQMRGQLVLAVLLSFLAAHTLRTQPAGDAVRIACIGNSITYGAGIKDREKNSYPAHLGRLLGPTCDVKNFGVSGRTLLRRGDYPYWKEKAFADAKAFLPHIIVIKLGTNDSKPQNWQYREDFVKDYSALIEEFRSLPSHPEIWICHPVPAFQDEWGIRDSVIVHDMIPMIDAVARTTKVKTIDLYMPLLKRGAFFPDHIHPDAYGARLIADEVLKAVITGPHLSGKLPLYKKSSAPVEKRVEDLLSRMTLEEKIDMLGGVEDFFIRPNERLGIPKIKMADGPLGVRNYGEATAFAAQIAVAASFNTDLMTRVGEAVGREARSKGVHIMLAPGVNIHRAPMCGRNFEYLGEDPFLAGKMAAAYVRGVQSQGVVATVKHFAANNQEYDRNSVSSDVDERTLQEIYLPAFKAAVQEGGAGAIMNSYNPLNGVHCSQNSHILREILKDAWKFDGIVMSDWGSVYDGVAAAQSGLDLEMPSGKFMNRASLLPAIESGKLKSSVIDDKVRRMLRIMFRFGFFDREQEDPSLPRYSPGSRLVALQAAREGTVLLKNEGGVLPLDRSQIHSVSVIGPNAHPAVTGGGGSSQVQPFRSVSVLDGMIQVAGSGVKVFYQKGLFKDMNALFTKPSFSPEKGGAAGGLKGEYYTTMSLEGVPAFTRTDERVDFHPWGSVASGFPTTHFSVRWSGWIHAGEAGLYDFIVTGDDGFRLWVDGRRVINAWRDQPPTTETKSLPFEANSDHEVKLEYYQNEGGAEIRFGCGKSVREIDERALGLARQTDAAVVCVGFDPETEGEGDDRSFALSAEEELLIKEVAAVNPRTIVVLTAGGNVAMEGWLGDVRGLIHSWYPGQEGGTAMAEIIFGDVTPSGKLPVSFEKRWEDNATYKSYYDEGGTKRVHYSEGVFLGYRHFDAKNVEPRFPFGYGLSYTTFSYSGLELSAARIHKRDTLAVRFTVTNTGSRQGAEAAQLYIRQIHSSEPRPVKELKGFAKVSLAPGESKRVEVSIGTPELSFYSGAGHQWTSEPGEFEVMIGSSSRDIRLTKIFTLD